MHSSQFKIGAISTFLDHLKKLDVADGMLLYFRGHSKSSYKLEPSIYRNTGWIANEAAMIKELILRCPNDFSGGLSTFQCLVKMQHYGLPTRLLDITSNPLVALYFACETHDTDDKDGEVIVFGYDVDQVKYFDSDTVSVVANLSRRSVDFTVPDVTDIVAFNESEGIKLLLHDIRQDKPHFAPIIRSTDLERVVCVKPMLDNPRIIRQEGAFLLFGCNEQKQRPAGLEAKTILGRLIINRDKKKELSNHLETLGVSKATMFPEIEHVAKHIKDAYYIPTIREADLTDVQKRVVSVLRKNGTGSSRDVAAILGITASSTGHLISRLLEMGVVESVGSGREQRWQLRKLIRLVKDLPEVDG